MLGQHVILKFSDIVNDSREISEFCQMLVFQRIEALRTNMPLIVNDSISFFSHYLDSIGVKRRTICADCHICRAETLPRTGIC